MGTLQRVLWSFLCCFITVQSFHSPDDLMFHQDFQSPFDDNWFFPFEGNLNFPLFDTIFSSWKKWSPDFHMLAEFPPIMDVPRVQVFCDETKLTLLVDKEAFGVALTAEEIQLGNGCYSNQEEKDQLVFIYNLDQCGTTSILQNGLQTFTNLLHMNLKKKPTTLWQTNQTIHISCTPKRIYMEPNTISQPSWAVKRFEIQAMNPSWTQRAESNVYKRGQVVRLQVSAETRPGQQLFIQSCFVSASPEPQARPRHAVILNKGCASTLGSPHPVALFAATNRADVVNLMLNTSYLIAELYVHCSVVLSDLGVNTAAKSCNYNSTGSRWEELSGDTEVCACCSSKCKGQSHKNLPDGAKGAVSLGPLLIVDEWEFSTVLPDSKRLESGSSLPTTTRAPTVPGEDGIVSSVFLSQGELQSSPKGVLVVHQEPTTRLTVWLPEQVQGDLPTASSQWDTKLVDGWQIPQKDFSFEFQRKSRYDHLDTEKNKPGFPHPTEMDVNPLLVEPKAAVPDATAQERQMNKSPSSNSELQRDAAVEPDLEVQPIIRTKLEFSKGADGSKKLSYEEEVKQQETRHEAKDGVKRKHRLKGLRLTFVDLLRKMDKEK